MDGFQVLKSNCTVAKCSMDPDIQQSLYMNGSPQRMKTTWLGKCKDKRRGICTRFGKMHLKLFKKCHEKQKNGDLFFFSLLRCSLAGAMELAALGPS